MSFFVFVYFPLLTDYIKIQSQLTFESMNGSRLMFEDDLYDNTSDSFMSWKVIALRTVTIMFVNVLSFSAYHRDTNKYDLKIYLISISLKRKFNNNFLAETLSNFEIRCNVTSVSLFYVYQANSHNWHAFCRVFKYYTCVVW